MENKGYKYTSQNTSEKVNGGPTRGGKGSEKSTTYGASTNGDATNKKATWGSNPKEASPSSTSQSRNR